MKLIHVGGSAAADFKSKIILIKYDININYYKFKNKKIIKIRNYKYIKITMNIKNKIKKN